MLITDATPYSIYWPTMLSKERYTREYKDELTVAQLFTYPAYRFVTSSDVVCVRVSSCKSPPIYFHVLLLVRKRPGLLWYRCRSAAYYTTLRRNRCSCADYDTLARTENLWRTYRNCNNNNNRDDE